MRVLCLFSALLLSSAMSAGADPVALKDSVPHISATGSASIEVVPDRAVLHLGAPNERPTADAAAEATAQAATTVIADIKAHGVDAKDIKTSFDLSAQFDETTDAAGHRTGQKLRGYLAVEDIQVRLDDVAKAGGLARELVSKGANSFEGIDFTYSRSKQAMRDLNAAALRDAVAEARSYTDAAGLKLGRVLQIGADPSEPDNAADLPSRRRVPHAAVIIPMEPGTRKLEKSVTVIFEIEGKAP